MQTVDVLIIGIAAIAILGTVGGVVYYEPSSSTTFDVSFATSSMAGPSDRFTVAGEGSGEKAVEIDVFNLTRIVFDISVQASGGAPLSANTVTYQAEVRDAAGNAIGSDTATLSGTGTSASMSIAIEDDLCTVPETVEQTGSDTATVGAEAADEHTCTDAAGTYTLSVSVSGDNPGPAARTHTIAFDTTLTTYASSVTIATDLSDTV